MGSQIVNAGEDTKRQWDKAISRRVFSTGCACRCSGCGRCLFSTIYILLFITTYCYEYTYVAWCQSQINTHRILLLDSMFSFWWWESVLRVYDRSSKLKKTVQIQLPFPKWPSRCRRRKRSQTPSGLARFYDERMSTAATAYHLLLWMMNSYRFTP